MKTDHDFPTGHASDEAKAMRLKSGFNEIPHQDTRSLPRILITTLIEPMFVLLFIAAGLYLALGDPFESLLMIASIGLTIGISLYQEVKTEHAIATLKQLSSPRALVIRDGVPQRIPGRDVVLDDVVWVNEGDRVPADAELIENRGFSVDESMLTGESMSAQKKGGDLIFSGTLAVSGSAFARVTAIGEKTELGKISKSLADIHAEPTRLQREIRTLVRWLFLGGLSLCIAVILADGWWTGQWLNASLKGITLALSMLPEEFPVILTVFMALGAWRMTKVGVLVRNLPILEVLGTTNVLCADKTGTLTYNQLEVRQLWVPDTYWQAEQETLDETFHPLLEYAVLASKKDPFDPMEKALLSCLMTRLGHDPKHHHPRWNLIKEYPLTDRLMAMSMVWKADQNKSYIVAAKGSPESIWQLCQLSTNDIQSSQDALENMATAGLRVIGVAKTTTTSPSLPPDVSDFSFVFLGLIGFEDPIRKEVPAAIAKCRSAGIRVMMLTGDYPQTAQVIAEKCGLENAQLIVGSQIETYSDQTLQPLLAGNAIFARVLPAQKLRIVEVLKNAKNVVCMTGDGVNDAPALKAADVGVAMGKRGTDVAREAADIVLTEDHFPAMVDAIAWGRRVYDNLRKASAFVLAMHVPIAGLSLIPVLLQWPSIFFPIHIVFMELIIDPVCALMFESEPAEDDLMTRPPRSGDSRLFTWPLLFRSLAQGLLMLATVLSVYGIAVFLMDHTPTEGRTLSVVTLVILTLILILSDRRSKSAWWRFTLTPNPYQWPLMAVIGCSVLAMVYLGPFQRIFHFQAIAGPGWIMVAIAALVAGTILDQLKRLLPS